MAKGHRSQIKRERNAQKDTRPSAKLSYARICTESRLRTRRDPRQGPGDRSWYPDLQPALCFRRHQEAS